MPTFELLYVSTRPRKTTDQIVVDDIVLPAMRVNRALDITGCLWFGPTRFLQILEGEKDVVEELYARIQQDTRHRDVRLVHSGPIAARSFQRWAMHPIKGSETDEISALLSTLAPNAVPLTAPASTPTRVPENCSLRVKLLSLATRKHAGTPHA
ncbi:MAG: BluF domain-containing protein [Phycisphaeraceae bacterium]|nr:MAG: BluF domain-containing protein [Phycisphaeraceae bacterium]